MCSVKVQHCLRHHLFISFCCVFYHFYCFFFIFIFVFFVCFPPSTEASLVCGGGLEKKARPPDPLDRSRELGEEQWRSGMRAGVSSWSSQLKVGCGAVMVTEAESEKAKENIPSASWERWSL